jgi:hypothetical protein
MARNLDDHDPALMQMKVRRGGPSPRSQLRHCGPVMKHEHQTLAKVLIYTTLQYGDIVLLFIYIPATRTECQESVMERVSVF